MWYSFDNFVEIGMICLSATNQVSTAVKFKNIRIIYN